MKVKKSMNRLYKLIVKEDNDACLLTKSDETTQLWHTRLGHINFQDMLLISRNRMVRGLPNLTQPKELCEGCLMAKQARHSFPAKTEFTAKQRLELIHGNICGPITPSTLSKNKYFLLLVDDFSKDMWIYICSRRKMRLLGVSNDSRH